MSATAARSGMLGVQAPPRTRPGSGRTWTAPGDAAGPSAARGAV